MNEIANLSITQKKPDQDLSELHWAIVSDNIKTVRSLLRQGANANEKTRIAIVNSEEDEDCRCDCTNAKFCYHVADEYGSEVKRAISQNALHLAARSSSLDVVKLVVSFIADVDAAAGDGSTALHFSTQNADVQVAEYLLESGAKVDAPDNQGKTPFYLAVKFERLELAAMLLQRGASVNVCTKSRSTPLYSALINTNVELVKLLLYKDASIDVTNRQDENPLFYVLRVVEKGDTRLSLIELLLDHGVSADSRSNGYDSTALHLAVEHRDADLARLLVQRGCSIDAKDCLDASPLSKAVCMNLQAMAKLLLQLGARVNDFVKQSSILEHAVIRRNEAMVALLLDHGADVNIGSERNTPMAAALQHKNTRIMQLLVEKGADIHYKDRNGRTPLMHAIKELNYEMMRYLLQHGADINQRDNRGNTAFHVLFENYSNSEYSIEYFLDNGADINAENDDGLTPFTFMMKHSFTKNEVLLFVKRLSLMEAQNGYVNPRIVAYLKRSRLWWQYWTSCHSELDRMREIRIFYEYSYFDILCKRYKELMSFLQNDKAVEAFETDVYLYNFCYYESMLVRNFSRKRERLRLLVSCSGALIGLFEGVLPPEIVEKLCEYMANEHLKRLIELFTAEAKLREEASSKAENCK